MGWDQKDAVGESLREGDRVKVFRDFGEDEDCADVVGRVGFVAGIEFPYYTGRLHVMVSFSDGCVTWIHNMSVMKV